MDDRPLKVFVSSTIEDLKVHRAAVLQIIAHMKWAHLKVGQESQEARPGGTVQERLTAVAGADLVILIMAFRRGYIPSPAEGGDGTKSITALELEEAKRRNVAVLVFLADDNWPFIRGESDPAARDWVTAFRETLRGNPFISEFESEPEGNGPDSERLPKFRAKVRQALQGERERRRANPGPKAAPGTTQLFEMARAMLLTGNCLPFIGPGVYDPGPLGTGQLVPALCQNIDQPDRSIATAAEYSERFNHSRTAFLTKLTSVLRAQARDVKKPEVYRMLARLRLSPPGLIVSATFDLQLENELEAEGKRCLIVSHVLRAFDDANDGKILAIRNGADPVICDADKLDLHGVDCVVYKPLGSPLLHSRVEQKLELDTVVVTETDHWVFLGRLAHQHTMIPNCFSRIFQRCPMIFLGYPMDVWDYRLVMQVLENVKRQSTRARPFGPVPIAVRQSTSAMEALAWTGLGAERLEEDPNDFARRVLESLEAPHVA